MEAPRKQRPRLGITSSPSWSWCVFVLVIVVIIVVIACRCWWCLPEPQPSPDLGDPGIAGAPFEDVIETPYASHEVVALVDGEKGECLNDLPSGPFIANTVGLGNFTDQCGSSPRAVVLFSAGRRVRFFDPNWSSGYDQRIQTASTPVTEDAPRVVELRIWKGVKQDASDAPIDLAQFRDVVSDEVKFVNAIFRKNRTGIEFKFDPSAIQDLGVHTDGVCWQIKDGTPPFSSALNPQYMEVFYLDMGGITSGLACDWNADASPDGAIIVDYFDRLGGTSLAHELGHTLGLMNPTGDVDVYTGFTPDNLMWRSITFPNPGASRDEFTLGQIFRMNAAANSWLVLKAPTPLAWEVDCQTEYDKDHPCPYLYQHMLYLP